MFCYFAKSTYFGAIWACDLNFESAFVLDHWAAIFLCFQRQCPYSELILLTVEFISVPVVEIAKLHKDKKCSMTSVGLSKLTIVMSYADGAHSR